MGNLPVEPASNAAPDPLLPRDLPRAPAPDQDTAALPADPKVLQELFLLVAEILNQSVGQDHPSHKGI